MPGPENENRKKQRRMEHINQIPNKFYIFCEGEKTEPLYFEGFKKQIQSSPVYKNLVHIEVMGVGAETLRVLARAERYVAENEIQNAQIWCVYDKDSFPAQDFNAVPERMGTLNSRECNVKSDVKYYAAWSNQCIEYWFLLHFDRYESNNDREYYSKYLRDKFSELGLPGYKKNSADLFCSLTEHGSPTLAMRRAKERLGDCDGQSETDCAPATTVHRLVRQLAEFLPEAIRGKYI